jgi:hypothetical protein
MMDIQATDIIVDTDNPTYLDKTVQQLGPYAVIQDEESSSGYLWHQGGYVVRCFSNPGYLEFAVTNQGYGKVVKRLDDLL